MFQDSDEQMGTDITAVRIGYVELLGALDQILVAPAAIRSQMPGLPQRSDQLLALDRSKARHSGGVSLDRQAVAVDLGKGVSHRQPQDDPAFQHAA